MYEKEYNDLINYTPKNLKNDTIHKLKSPLLKGSFNTIGNLETYYRFKDEFKIPESDIKWLEHRIEQVAKELFIDGKKILISVVGGYSGCPRKMIDTIRLNNIEITNLKFCQSCTDSYRSKNFIEKFNSKMYSLMKIEPPNEKTYKFYGKFGGYDKNNNRIELILEDDRTFKFWRIKDYDSGFTEGLWKNRNDTLILNSKTLTKNDTLTLWSAKWIEFSDLKFRLKKEKLIELNKRKKKLKKIVE